MKNSSNSPVRLSYSGRLKKIGLGLLYFIAAITLVLYGMILTTNLLTQLSPSNTLVYYSFAMTCYGLIIAGLYVLWLKLHKTLNQAFSGFDN